MVEHNCSKWGVHCSGIIGCTKVVDVQVVTCEKEDDAGHGNEGGKAKFVIAFILCVVQGEFNQECLVSGSFNCWFI